MGKRKQLSGREKGKIDVYKELNISKTDIAGVSDVLFTVSQHIWLKKIHMAKINKEEGPR